MSIALGVIGCGGRVHTIVKGMLEKHPQIRLVGTADVDPLSLERFRPQLAENGREFADYQDLLEQPLDWVVVGSYNAQHAEHAVAALDAGFHVFCEKPLATNVDDCLAIRDAAKRSGKVFAFGLVLRYSRFYQKLKSMLDGGAVGRILSFEFNETLPYYHGAYIHGNWRRFIANAGTHLLEKCCHDIDLANWMTDSLPVKVASFGGLDFFNPENKRHFERVGVDAKGKSGYLRWEDRAMHANPFTAEKDIIDNQVAILEYASGARGTFHTNCNAAIPERRFYILGTEGSLRGDLLIGRLEYEAIKVGAQREVFEIADMDGHGGADPILQDQLGRTMLHGIAPLAGIDEGLRSAISAFGIDQAMETNQVVDLRPMWAMAGIDPGIPS